MMAKNHTLEELEARRKEVVQEFACGHIKRRPAIRLIKRYDEKIKRAEGNHDVKLSRAIHAARTTLQRFGFDVVERIVVADRKSGRIYR